MNIKIQCKNYNLSKHESDAVEKKLQQSLKKYKTGSDNMDITVKIIDTKGRIKAEISMPYMNYKIHSEHESNDGVLTSVDRCIDALERQIAKYKTRIHKSKYSNQKMKISEFAIDNDIDNIDEDAANRDVIKVESYQMKPMNVEEAVLQMELMNFKFHVFYNNETNTTCVVYHRDDGNIGLIEPELI